VIYITNDQEIFEKIDNLETNFKKEMEKIKRNVGIEDVPRPRGKRPVLITKLHTMLNGRYGYNKGLSIDQIAVSLYGQSSWQTRTKARQMLALLRKRFDLAVYSVRPLGVSGNRKERYCILNNKGECKVVVDQLRKINKGLKKSKIRVEKREKQIENKEEIKKAMKLGEKNE